MPLQDQVIPVSFGLGLDTKSDPKQVVQGKMLQLQDAVITKTGQIAKRPGYNNILNIQSEVTRGFGNQLLLADGQNVYSYATDTGTTTNVGNYQSVSVTPQNVPVLNPGAYAIRCATMLYNGVNYLCTVYSTNSTGIDLLYINVINQDTGVTLIADTLLYTPILTNKAICAQPVAIGANTGSPVFGITFAADQFGVNSDIYYAQVAAPFNSPSLITTPSILVTIPNTDVVNSMFMINNGSATSYFTWMQNASGVGNALKMATVVSGAVTATATLGVLTGTGFPYYSLSTVFDASGNIWVGVGGGGLIYYAIETPALTAVKAPTQIVSYTPSNGFTNMPDPMGIAFSPQAGNTSFKLYYNRITTGTGVGGGSGAGISGTISGTYVLIDTWVSTLTTSSFTAPVTYYKNAMIQSNFVPVTGTGLSGGNVAIFANVYPYSQFGGVNSANPGTQNTFFLVNEATTGVIGKCLSGEAINYWLDCGAQHGAETGQPQYYPQLQNIWVSGNSVIFPAQYVQQTLAIQEAETPSVNFAIYFNENAVKLEAFNFADPQAYQTTIYQNTAVFNGAVLKAYDGSNFTELGFNTYPEIVNIFQQTGGEMADGAYGFAITYAWIDNNNQLYESVPALINFTVSGGGGTAGIQMAILPLSITDKVGISTTTSHRSTPPVAIRIYRTDNNGNILYFMTQIVNDGTQSTNTSGNGPGGTLVGQPEIYTTGGVLDNDAPPASMILTVRLNRLYAVDSENSTTDYWYTKTQNKGFGISFSGFLVETIDSVGGNITSQAQMDEKLVTFKQSAFGFQYGDGPNDTGNPASSTLTPFQFIPADTSSSNHRATITIPNGVVFQSPKGLYMLSRGLQVGYFGSPVARYNSQFYTAAIMLHTGTSVRFLTNSGLSLTYNYFYDQWSVFTNHQGTSGDIFEDTYVYSRTDGTVYQENPTSFLDNTTPYALTAQISWIKFAGIQGFQRVKQAFLLGDHLSPVTGHGVQMSAAYDFNQSNFNTPVGYTFNSTGSVFQYREFLAQQKCDSLTLLIQEVVTGASGEYIDLTDLSFYAAVKKGPHKLSAANSVG